jgi:hypothetical protein
LRHPLI